MLLTDHDDFDYEIIKKESNLIIDTRGVFKPSKKLSMHNSNNIGHIGCGYWGKNIIKTLYEMECLYGIADTNQESLDDIRKNVSKDIPFYDTDTLIASSELKAITLATPAETHYEIGMKILESGKNLYVEKPLTLNFNEAKNMVDYAHKNKLTLQVGHLMIYHPAFKKLKDLIKKDYFGKILYIFSNRLKWGKVRDFENVIWSFAPHDISMISYLLDSKLQLENAYSKKLIPGTEDTAHIFLSSNSGTHCHINCSWLNPFKEFKFCIVGDKQSAVYDDGNDFISIFETDLLSSSNSQWEAPGFEKLQFDSSIKPLTAALEDFITSCDNLTVPLASGRNGLEVVKLLECING